MHELSCTNSNNNSCESGCSTTMTTNFDDFESETRMVVMDFMGLVPLSCPPVTKNFEPFQREEDVVDSASVSAISNRDHTPLKMKSILKSDDLVTGRVNFFKKHYNSEYNTNQKSRTKYRTIIRKNDKLIILEDLNSEKSEIDKDSRQNEILKLKESDNNKSTAMSRLQRLKNRVKNLNFSISLPKLNAPKLSAPKLLGESSNTPLKTKENVSRLSSTEKIFKKPHLTARQKSISDHQISKSGSSKKEKQQHNLHTNTNIISTSSSSMASNVDNGDEEDDSHTAASDSSHDIVDGSSVDSLDSGVLRPKQAKIDTELQSSDPKRETLYVDVNNVNKLEMLVHNGQVSPVAVPLQKELYGLRISDQEVESKIVQQDLPQARMEEGEDLQSPQTPQSLVADTLRAIADQVQAEYTKEISDAVNKLVVYENCKKLTFEVLKGITMEIIKDVTPGWAQVVVPLVIGQSAAMSLLLLGDRSIVARLVDYTTRFLCDNMNDFVIGRGGWNGVMDAGISGYPVLLNEEEEQKLSQQLNQQLHQLKNKLEQHQQQQQQH